MKRPTFSAVLGAAILLATAVAAALLVRAPAPRTGPVGGPRVSVSALLEQRERSATDREADRGADGERHERGGERGRHPEHAGGPSAEAVDQRAYPRRVIDARRAGRARAAFLSAPAPAASRAAAQLRSPLPATWEPAGTTPAQVPGDASFTGAAQTVSGRVTALAIDPNCSLAGGGCRAWLAAAGGGIWRSDDVLAATPLWRPSSDGLTTAAFGSLVVDPGDPSGQTLYAGSGEANGSSDSEAGAGLFRSTDGGLSWSLLPGSAAAARDRAIGAIAIGPGGTIWIGTGVARHGSGAASGGAATPPGAPALGLYRSTDGGASFVLVFSKPAGAWFQGSLNDVELDPNDPTTIFAAVTGYGVWRAPSAVSAAQGSFAQVFATVSPQGFGGADVYGDRTEFALADLGTQTRMYAGDSSESANAGSGSARLWRADGVGVATPASTLVSGGPGAPVNQGPWTALSSATRSQAGFTSYRYCQEQCGYDNVVVADPSDPAVVLLGGAFEYGDFGVSSNGRAIARSTDAGVTFSDLSSDASDACDTFSQPIPPNSCPAGIHPDAHAIALVPDHGIAAQRGVVLTGTDGGVARSGLDVVPAVPQPGDTPGSRYVSRAIQCGPTGRGLSGADLQLCQRLLAQIPYRTSFINGGLDTLQFQSVAGAPGAGSADVLAGSQDNGTWARRPDGRYFMSIGGDGGGAVIDARVGDPGHAARVHSYPDGLMDVNYGSSNPPGTVDDWAYDPAYGTANPNTWLFISAPLKSSGEQFSFYAPLIGDPALAATLFTGGGHVWRTRNLGGSRTTLDQNCQDNAYNPLPVSIPAACGDWQALGPSLTGGDPTNSVVALARAPSDQGTLWAATRHGELWISRNAEANAGAVTFTRVLSTTLPGRFVSGIQVDPADPSHAWVAYSGYDAYTPATPGHLFDVLAPAAGSASASDLSGSGADGLGDLPVTALARDDATDDLYVASDFGVLRLPSGAGAWSVAAPGLPLVAVYGLSLLPDTRQLLAATHGRGLWRVALGGSSTVPLAPALPETAPLGSPAAPATPGSPAPRALRRPLFRSVRVQRFGARVRVSVVLRQAGGLLETVVRDRRGRRVGKRTLSARSGRPLRFSVHLRRGAGSLLSVRLTARNASGSSTIRRSIRPPRRVRHR